MALAKTDKPGWRMWAICHIGLGLFDGIGPINGLVFVNRRLALACKQSQFPDNDNYQVRRVQVLPDPEKRRK